MTALIAECSSEQKLLLIVRVVAKLLAQLHQPDDRRDRQIAGRTQRAPLPVDGDREPEIGRPQNVEVDHAGH